MKSQLFRKRLNRIFFSHPLRCCVAVGEEAAGAPWALTAPGRLRDGRLPAPAARGRVRIWMPPSYTDRTMGFFVRARADIQPRCGGDGRRGVKEKRRREGEVEIKNLYASQKLQKKAGLCLTVYF